MGTAEDNFTCAANPSTQFSPCLLKSKVTLLRKISIPYSYVFSVRQRSWVIVPLRIPFWDRMAHASAWKYWKYFVDPFV